MSQTDAWGLAIIHATHATHTHPCYTRHSHSSMLHTPLTLIHATHTTHTHPCYTRHSHSSMLHTPLTLIHATHTTHTHPCYTRHSHSSMPFILSLHTLWRNSKNSVGKVSAELEYKNTGTLSSVKGSINHISINHCTGLGEVSLLYKITIIWILSHHGSQGKCTCYHPHNPKGSWNKLARHHARKVRSINLHTSLSVLGLVMKERMNKNSYMAHTNLHTKFGVFTEPAWCVNMTRLAAEHTHKGGSWQFTEILKKHEEILRAVLAINSVG